MGVIKRGILGGFSGKVANVVGTSWKGIAVMKSLPLSVANPNTLAQQTQRGALSQAVACGQDVTIEAIRALNNRWAGQMSGFNSFVSRATPKFKAGNDLAPYVKMFSEGTYTAPQPLGEDVATNPSTNIVTAGTANWENNTSYSATDKVYIFAQNKTTGEWAVLAVGEDFSTASGQASLQMTSGDVVDVYFSVVKADGTLVSDSVGVRTTVA